MATDSNIASDDRIGGYRYIRTIHPGATSVVMEVLAVTFKCTIYTK